MRERAGILSMKLHAWKREDINPERVEAWNADYRGTIVIGDSEVTGRTVKMMRKEDEKGGLLEVRRLRERGGQCEKGEHMAKGVTKNTRVKRL